MNISVIIPVYNAEKYVEKAVRSALQFDVVQEVILVEDCSPDDALAICRRLDVENERVKLFQHPQGINKGAGASRNLGMDKATMDYIAFLDADDYFLPNRFDKEIEQWKNDNIFDGMYNAIGVDFMTENARKMFCQRFGLTPEKVGDYLTTIEGGISPEDLFLALNNVSGDQYKGYFSLDGFIIKRTKIIEFNLGFNEALRLHQDTVFILQCSYYLKLIEGELSKAVSIRGVHDDNRITHADKKVQFRNRFLMARELWKWSNDNKIDNVVPYYFFNMKFNEMKMGSWWSKWRIYFQLVFSGKQFYKKQEAKKIHFNIIRNTFLQRVYAATYVRINRILLKNTAK